MEDVEFKTAIWGLSWEEALRQKAPQGTASVSDKGVLLEIPFGLLLSNPGNVVLGRTTSPECADALYGITQDGYRIVLEDARSCGSSESSIGGKRQTIRARHLFAREGIETFDIEAPVTKVAVELKGLKEWYGKPAFEVKKRERPL